MRLIEGESTAGRAWRMRLIVQPETVHAWTLSLPSRIRGTMRSALQILLASMRGLWSLHWRRAWCSFSGSVLAGCVWQVKMLHPRSATMLARSFLGGDITTISQRLS
jgi:hypothetical protein